MYDNGRDARFLLPRDARPPTARPFAPPPSRTGVRLRAARRRCRRDDIDATERYRAALSRFHPPRPPPEGEFFMYAHFSQFQNLRYIWDIRP